MISKEHFIIDDTDPQFIAETKEKDGHYIELYTFDTKELRKLLTKDGTDPFQKYEEDGILVSAENYQLNFYTEYYPYTDKVAVKFSVEGFDKEADKAIQEIFTKCNNTDGRYISLSKEEETMINKIASKYILGFDLLEELERE